MARLVEIGGVLPAALTVKAGDVLNFTAGGGLVEAGEDIVEPLGPFVPGVLGLDGRLLSPETAPTNMLFRALVPGRARIVLFPGSGPARPGPQRIDILVEP